MPEKINFKEIKLIYRGTQDGFNAKKFHELCDNKGATLSIIKARTGKRFGGFTKLSWDSSNSYKMNDPAAFLFSVD